MNRLRTSVPLRLAALATVLALVLAACGQPAGQGTKAFSYKVDTSIAPSPATVGTRPLAAISDANGNVSLFIANSFLLHPTDKAQLDAVVKDLNDHGLAASVVGNDGVPQPPPGSGIKMDSSYQTPTTWIIKIDPSQGHSYLDTFDLDAAKVGLDGAVTISSSDAAALLAVVTHEAALGIAAGPDFVAQADAFTSTQEAPNGSGGFLNAFGLQPFETTGSKSDVTEAWQVVHAAAAGSWSPVHVAIIDGGFWLDTSGHPGTASTGSWVSDLPYHPIQYDFAGNDYTAGGPSLAHCTGGGACPWHGNGSAGTVAGILNNRYGAAGTGGQVVDPWLFKSDLSDDQIGRAVRTAVAWGAGVISMSFGGSCNAFCGLYGHIVGFNGAFADARRHGVVLVAAAGNDNQDVNAVNMEPCVLTGVICVGALADGSSNKIGYSNYGSSVDIYAPTDIPVMPNPNTSPHNALHNGTSASTPFVAGVAAMLKAFNPGLTSDDVDHLLRTYGWTDSTDPHVDRYINAYASLRAVVSGSANVPPSMTLNVASSTVDLNRGFQVTANTSDLEDGTPCCTVSWNPAPTSTSDNGRLAVFTLGATGSHTLRATATDSGGATATADVTVNVVNSPPTATIQQPVAGAHVLSGASVQLLGSATDPNEGPGPGPGALSCSALNWYSTDGTDTGFPATGCDVTVTFHTVGSRTIQLAATDPEGAVDRVDVSIVVDAAPTNYPPSITVGNLPPVNYNGDGYDWSSTINVSASATDPEGDTPITYTWSATSYAAGSSTTLYKSNVTIAGPTTTTGNLSWTPSNDPSLFIPDCTGSNAYYGQYVLLTLQATDSLGHSSSVNLPRLKVYRCILH